MGRRGRGEASSRGRRSRINRRSGRGEKCGEEEEEDGGGKKWSESEKESDAG